MKLKHGLIDMQPKIMRSWLILVSLGLIVYAGFSVRSLYRSAQVDPENLKLPLSMGKGINRGEKIDFGKFVEVDVPQDMGLGDISLNEDYPGQNADSSTRHTLRRAYNQHGHLPKNNSEMDEMFEIATGVHFAAAPGTDLTALQFGPFRGTGERIKLKNGKDGFSGILVACDPKMHHPNLTDWGNHLPDRWRVAGDATVVITNGENEYIFWHSDQDGLPYGLAVSYGKFVQ